jgi:hypothetical protein
MQLEQSDLLYALEKLADIEYYLQLSASVPLTFFSQETIFLWARQRSCNCLASSPSLPTSRTPLRGTARPLTSLYHVLVTMLWSPLAVGASFQPRAHVIEASALLAICRMGC